MTATVLNTQAGTASIAALVNKVGGSEDIMAIQTGGVNAVVINEIVVVTFSSTSATTIPRGTTDQRPVSPTNGMLRYNTTLNKLEGYSNGNWGVFA